jgi:gluconokinase
MGDYLYLQLFGRPTLSYSMASGTGLFSHRALDWEPTLLERVGVKREQLGELVDFDARNTGLAGKHAAGLKEFAGMPWFPAMADSACSNMGSGCVDASRLALNLGTSGAMRVVFNGPLKKIPDGLFCYVVGRGRLLLGGSISNCGNLRRWLLETFQLETNLDQNLAAMKPDSHGLTMLPFLAGERAPFWPRDVTGILVGLRGATRPIDIARAAFEALTYQLALIHERLVRTFPQAQKVIVSGGASSRWWVQMMADTFLMPVQFLQTAEASSRGAALLALEALGVVRDAASIEAPWGELVQPNEARSKIYRKSLRHYEALCHRWTTE